jgi:hypothetical protein
MCFSAEASFVVGGALDPAGAYCVYAALVKKPSYLGLAIVPLCFGIQQISEGFVWHALEHGDSAQVRTPALVFLFFAQAFWPWWFSAAAALMEPLPMRRWILVGLTLLTTVWFWVLYYPLLVGPTSLLTTKIAEEGHSVQYLYERLGIYDYVGKTPLRVLYFLSVALPPLVGSENWGRIPGLVLAATAVVAVMLYDYAFVSVWCFFAAVLAICCCVLFYRLPASGNNYTNPKR